MIVLLERFGKKPVVHLECSRFSPNRTSLARSSRPVLFERLSISPFAAGLTKWPLGVYGTTAFLFLRGQRKKKSIRFGVGTGIALNLPCYGLTLVSSAPS